MTPPSPRPTRSLLISTGDPAGIGPEICFKALKELRPIPGLQLIPVGDLGTLSAAAELAGYAPGLSPLASPGEAGDPEGSCEILQVEPEEAFERSRVSAPAGRQAYRILETCSRFALSGQAAGLVTCPISKEALARAGYGSLGHTEILGRLAGVASVETVFCVRELKIFFLTRHLSLGEALSRVKRQNILDALVRMNRVLPSLGVEDPRLGVAGLNPHCGDGGLFGREEIEEIAPAVAEARARGIQAVGPIGADSVFHLGLEGRFDAVLSLYHDQGHIAAKTHDFFGTVTLSLGLPYLRTSVDHGTGFDIAWIGKANPESLVRAVGLAAQILGRSNAPAERSGGRT